MRVKQGNRLLGTIIIIVLLCIGIGYAALTTNLSIAGTTSVTSNSWDIHFANLVESSGSVTPTTAAEIDTDSQTEIEFAATLSKPGDFYEFTVDIVNNGSIDGMVSSVVPKVNNQPISNIPNYLNFSLTYLDGYEIETNHFLGAGESDTIKVRVEFKKDITANDLLANSETTNFSIAINYVQSGSNAIHRYVYSSEVNYYINVGDSILTGGPFYNTISEARSNFYNEPFFIRHTISNNIILTSSLGFVVNNNYYYINIADSYTQTKEILQTAFNSNECSESTNYGSTQYNCERSSDNIQVLMSRNDSTGNIAVSVGTIPPDIMCVTYQENDSSSCFVQ